MKTKKQFEELPNTTLIKCTSCNFTFKKNAFTYKNIHPKLEGTCCFCDWMKRHDYAVPTIKGWDEEQVLTAIRFMLTDEARIINDLLLEFPTKTLFEICKLIVALKIKGKTYSVKTICEKCGAEFLCSASRYISSKYKYCSHECYFSDKSSKMKKGEESKFYNSITSECAHCHKPILIKPNSYKKTNRFGDHFNFCSQQCYWQFKSSYYVGEKALSKCIVWTPEMKEQAKQRIIKNSRSSERFNTKIQQKVNLLLEEKNIKYEREKIFGYYAVDNYLSDYNLIIEVMGDYWHTNPQKYNKNGYAINECQLRGIKKDKQKSSYIYNTEGIKILYLWETQILKNPELCSALISEYIKNNGLLENFHSFNYHLSSTNTVILNSNIIIPYQSQERSQY